MSKGQCEREWLLWLCPGTRVREFRVAKRLYCGVAEPSVVEVAVGMMDYTNDLAVNSLES
jgi:hypothetical protein